MKLQLSENLFSAVKPLRESVGDGWDGELAEYPVVGKIEELFYEIRMARRGVYTGAETYEQLADYIRDLSEKLNRFADVVADHGEDDE